MTCQNQDCEKCACTPTPAVQRQCPVHDDASDGFWKYFFFFTIGWLFIGC